MRLQALKIDADPAGDEFRLHVIKNRITFGLGLLDGLRDFAAEERRRFAQLFLLHELFHGAQGLYPSSADGLGRAGVVLEELDYDADSFALSSLTRWQLELGDRRAENPPREAIRGYLGTALRGLQAFDKLGSDSRIENLAERRLRRYLIWHLQYARAQTVTQSEHIEALLNDRVVVEVAPLRIVQDYRLKGILDSLGTTAHRNRSLRQPPNPPQKAPIIPPHFQSFGP